MLITFIFTCTHKPLLLLQSDLHQCALIILVFTEKSIVVITGIVYSVHLLAHSLYTLTKY